jgi:glycosyltransferase involved in cell wall biosynthesis
VRLIIIQHGDFGAAWQRFRDGGPETYRDQRASVAFVAGLAQRGTVVSLCICDAPHEREIEPGLWSVGIDQAQAYGPGGQARIAALLDRFAPDRIVARAPHLGVIRWARARRVPTLLSFADLFGASGLRGRMRNLRLRLLLDRRVFPCVANHSLNASRSVATALHYPRDRIVPWDWSPVPLGPERPPATGPRQAPQAFFAGALIESKGVGDCLEAVRLLRAQGIDLRFTFAGKGDIDGWRARAEALGIADLVSFAGLIPNPDVRTAMAAADMVVVPSHHAYPEGLPNTIYEALAARAPLVISDHPAFAGRLKDGEACLVFAAGQPQALADRLAALVQDAPLWTRLSQGAPAAHDGLYVGMEWTRLVETFLDDPQDRAGWVARNSLAVLDR